MITTSKKKRVLFTIGDADWQMSNTAWPFDQPPNCAVITLRCIVFDGAPILHVTHDADDHGWQFLGSEDADVKQASIVCFSEIVKRDPTLVELAGLPPGWHAWRESANSPWQRAANPHDEDTLA